MKLPALCLVVAAVIVASATLGQRGTAQPVRKADAAPTIQVSGPTVINLRHLPEPATSAGEVFARILPAIPAPRRLGQNGPAPEANVIDASAGVASAPALASGFEGLSNTDNLNIVGLDLSQPDPQLAVGPEHIVELINVLGRVFDRDGGTLRTFTVSNFFGIAPGHFAFNSRITYDGGSGRWFATAASFMNHPGGPDEGGLHLAVSQSSDALGGWNVYHREFVDIFPDQPSPGLTDDKVTISSAMYDIEAVLSGDDSLGRVCHAYCGEQTIVFQKSGLLAGIPADELGRYAFPMRPDRFAVRPAQSLTSTNDQYLGTFSTTSRSRLHVIRITGTPDEGNVTEAEMTELLVVTQLDPPPSITAGNADCLVYFQNHGPPPCIFSNDYRMIEAVWRDNRLWMAASAACRPPGDDTTRACAHLIEVETEGTPSKTQDIMYGAPGEYYSWPAIRTAANGDLIVAVAHTNPSIFAELRVAGWEFDDSPNAMQGSTLIKAGETVHTSGRWGDYFGAAVDPEHPNCIWIAGEFAKLTLGRDWSTYLASTSYRDGCAPPTPAATPVATPMPSPTPSSTPTPPAPQGDANCDTTVNSLDAALILQFGAGLVDSLTCPHSADVSSDGAVDSLDAALILQFSAGLISALPVP